MNNNHELERALVAAILINPGLLASLPTEPEHFTSTMLRRMFVACQELHNLGKDIDIYTLYTHLKGAVEATDISSVAAASGNSAYAETYADQLAELHDKRSIMQVITDAANSATNGGDDAATVAANVISKLSGVGVRGEGAQHISVHHTQAKEEIARRQIGDDKSFALTTDYDDLNTAIDASYPDDGTTILLVGEPGVGKTILAVDIIRNWSNQVGAAIYSLEMSSLRMMLRDYSQRTGLLVSKMKRGDVDISQLDALDGTYKRSNLYLSARPGWTTRGLRADLMRLKHEAGVRCYMLDYLSLLGDKGRAEEHDRVRELSSKILSINRSLGLACIAIHTLNKQGQVGGAAGVGYDADVIIKMTHGSPLASRKWREIKLSLLKNRDQEGFLADLELGLLNDKPHFVPVTYREGVSY